MTTWLDRIAGCAGRYIREHHFRLGLQAAGCAVTVALSLFAAPLLGAVGFGVSGPVAGQSFAVL